jgi:acetyl-CoA carboxylase biotin carboxyl carrier protein
VISLPYLTNVNSSLPRPQTRRYITGSGQGAVGWVGRLGRKVMDLKRIKDLIDLFVATDLGELNFSEGDCRLRLVRRLSRQEEHADSSSRSGVSESPVRPTTDVIKTLAPLAVRADAEAPVALDARVGAKDVVAPLHGVLHLTPSPDEPAFVALGDPVRVGQTLGVLEAMKMFHTLKSDFDGVVAAIRVVSGSEVEAGQALFRITSGLLPGDK